MKARVLFWMVFMISTLGLGACEPKSSTDPKLAEQARTAMVAWLECTRCNDQQLVDDLLKYGGLLRPMLIRTLEQGAAPASRALYVYQLEQRYDRFVAYSRKHSHFIPTLAKQDYVDIHLARFNSQYRGRAAQALAKIGGNSSRLALQEALNKSGSADIKEVIKTSLQEMKQYNS